MPDTDFGIRIKPVEGADAAKAAFEKVGQSAKKAGQDAETGTKKVTASGQAINAAFAGTGGALSVASGIQSTTAALKNFNAEGAALSGATLILDIGRMGKDFRDMGEGVSGATSMFGKLTAVMKANPILAVSTAIAAVAGALALFRKETSEAVKEQEKLAKAMREVQMSAAGQTFLGLTPGQEVQKAQLNAISQLAAVFGDYDPLLGRVDPQTRRQREDLPNLTYEDVAGRLGAPFTAGSLRQMGIDLLGDQHPERIGRRIGTVDASMRSAAIAQDPKVPREVARVILRKIFDDLNQQLSAQATDVAKLGPVGFGGASVTTAVQGTELFAPDLPPAGGPFMRGGTLFPAGYGTGSMLMRRQGDPGTFGFQPFVPQPLSPSEYGTGQFLLRPGGSMPIPSSDLGLFSSGQYQGAPFMTGEERERVEAERRQAALVAAQQEMIELIAKGREFGQTIGDAFMRIADGTSTAKQAMAELVRMFAQVAAREAFASMGSALFKNFGAPSSPGVDPAPLPPNS